MSEEKKLEIELTRVSINRTKAETAQMEAMARRTNAEAHEIEIRNSKSAS